MVVVGHAEANECSGCEWSEIWTPWFRLLNWEVPPGMYILSLRGRLCGGFIRFEGGIGVQVESFWASHQPEFPD